jgi:hypothetical protein
VRGFLFLEVLLTLIETTTAPKKKVARFSQRVDGRRPTARRARKLAAAYAAQIGGQLSPAQHAAVLRAAELVALAEHCRARRLSSDPAVSFDDVVRTDSAARRALRDLGLKSPGAAKPGPNLAEYLRSKYGAPGSAPTGSAASVALPDEPHTSAGAEGSSEAAE